MDATKTNSEMISFSQDNSQAFMRSSQIWTSGCQAIGQTVVTAAQAQFEQMMSGWKAMSGAKSFKQAVEMQSNLVRSSVEHALASTGKITGATMTLVEETVAPLTTAMTIAAEKFTIRAN